MEQEIQNQVSLLIGKYGWVFIVGVLTLLFRSTIEKFVAGLMVFMGNDYNEDDVVEVDGKPGRIVRVGMWTTTFFKSFIGAVGIIKEIRRKSAFFIYFHFFNFKNPRFTHWY